MKFTAVKESWEYYFHSTPEQHVRESGASVGDHIYINRKLELVARPAEGDARPFDEYIFLVRARSEHFRFD